MNEQPVTFSSGPLKLEGLLAIPRANGLARAAVVCHPHPLYGGSMNNNVVEAALAALWQLGFATLRFNFRGVGASDGEHSGGQGEVEDAAAAMRFLLAQPGVAQERAVMAGYSFGAAVAMRAGLELEPVAIIAAIALPVAMGDFSSVERDGKRFVFIAGDRDAYCPERAISDLAHNLGDGTGLKVIAGADHFFGGDEDTLSRTLAEMIGG
jgi:alpha/beta superfamily hydrolase